MKKIVSLCLLTCITSACTYSVSHLVRDDDLRHKLIVDCVKLGLKAKDEQNCINAAKAQARVTGDTVDKLKGLLD